MNFGAKKQPSCLSEWLEIATRGIAAPGKERIAREIEAHYAEAVEAHLGCGESESAAHSAALAELGDVRQSVRRFRRQHLMASEARYLEYNDKSSKSVFQLGVNYLLFCTLGFDLGRTFQGYAMTMPLVFLFLVALPTSAFFLARRGAGYPNGWLSTLIRCCNSPGLGITVLFGVPRQFGNMPLASIEHWVGRFLGLTFVIRLCFSLRLAKKLRGLQRSSNEIPPRPAALS